MKTPRPLSTASRRSLAKLRQSYERGLLATTIASVSRSYPTLALGILLLGYLSTELLPHSALSFGLTLCGGGAFLFGAISLHPHRSEAHDAEARGQARSTLALRIGLGLLLLLGARLYYARSMQEVIEAPPPLYQPLHTEVITVERVTPCFCPFAPSAKEARTTLYSCSASYLGTDELSASRPIPPTQLPPSK